MSTSEYLKDTYAEVGRIHWPSRKKASLLTLLVVAISLLTAAYLGVLDFIFTGIFESLIL